MAVIERKVMICGPSGSGKSFVSNKLTLLPVPKRAEQEKDPNYGVISSSSFGRGSIKVLTKRSKNPVKYIDSTGDEGQMTLYVTDTPGMPSEESAAVELLRDIRKSPLHGIIWVVDASTRYDRDTEPVLNAAKRCLGEQLSESRLIVFVNKVEQTQQATLEFNKAVNYVVERLLGKEKVKDFHNAAYNFQGEDKGVKDLKTVIASLPDLSLQVELPFIFGASLTTTLIFSIAWAVYALAFWGVPPFLMQLFVTIAGSVACQLDPVQLILVAGLWSLDFINDDMASDPFYGIVLVVVFGAGMLLQEVPRLLETRRNMNSRNEPLLPTNEPLLPTSPPHHRPADLPSEPHEPRLATKPQTDSRVTVLWSLFSGTFNSVIGLVTGKFCGPISLILWCVGSLIIARYVKKAMEEVVNRIARFGYFMSKVVEDAMQKAISAAEELFNKLDEFWSILRDSAQEMRHIAGVRTAAGACFGVVLALCVAMLLGDSGLVFTPSDTKRAKALAYMQSVFFLKPLLYVTLPTTTVSEVVALALTLVPLLQYLSSIHEKSQRDMHVELVILILCYFVAVMARSLRQKGA
ncbi:unnamed protein product [Symbiodinium sp. CCMP2592]|nr:unnamed protein product [Symbiodinium sp. CCMP2592]